MYCHKWNGHEIESKKSIFAKAWKTSNFNQDSVDNKHLHEKRPTVLSSIGFYNFICVFKPTQNEWINTENVEMKNGAYFWMISIKKWFDNDLILSARNTSLEYYYDLLCMFHSNACGWVYPFACNSIIQLKILISCKPKQNLHSMEKMRE